MYCSLKIDRDRETRFCRPVNDLGTGMEQSTSQANLQAYQVSASNFEVGSGLGIQQSIAGPGGERDVTCEKQELVLPVSSTGRLTLCLGS